MGWQPGDADEMPREIREWYESNRATSPGRWRKLTIHAIDNLFMWIILGLLGLCFVLGMAIGAEFNASQLRDEIDATLCGEK
jgi:hypothetical protein